MKLFITGICGFVGSSLAVWFRENHPEWVIGGMDNFIRPGSETNRLKLRSIGVSVRHGDVRQASDFEGLPAADWVIDAAANPSVLAGVDGNSSTRQLLEHNLLGTINILEYCKRDKAGFVLLSTSRVYSINTLASLPLSIVDDAFQLDDSSSHPIGISSNGVNTMCSTASPISLYGATKLASEALALEYGATFSLPVWINRCGVLAGAGQFGTAEQGIFSYWIHSFAARRPLCYIGFGGKGHQVRDALHPVDLARLVNLQLNKKTDTHDGNRIFNVGGGLVNSMSLAQLTAWCAEQFGQQPISCDGVLRPFDIPWYVTDNDLAHRSLAWEPGYKMSSILLEIADFARRHPSWLDQTVAR
jgi:CDP-paratose 2-epimerase